MTYRPHRLGIVALVATGLAAAALPSFAAGVSILDPTTNKSYYQGNPMPVGAGPYQYTPLSPGQHNLAVAASTALTIPTGATYASITVSGAPIRYTTDGTTTPTASVGQPVQINQSFALSGATVLANFRAIQQTPTATLDVEFFK